MGNHALQQQFYREQVRTPPQLKLCLGSNKIEILLDGNEDYYFNKITINNAKNMRGGGEGWWNVFLWNPIGSVFGIGRALKL